MVKETKDKKYGKSSSRAFTITVARDPSSLIILVEKMPCNICSNRDICMLKILEERARTLGR